MRLLKVHPWYIKPFLKLLFKEENILWIAVSENIKNQLIFKGVKPKLISIIPAFISIENSAIPLESEIIEFRKSKSTLFTVYAVSTSTNNNTDLYGIDLALSLIYKLSLKYSDIGLVVCIPGNKIDEIMTNYKKFIFENNIENNVHWVVSNVENIRELWRITDIFLRPTCTDGDSLCIREALEEKTIVLASDVVSRPEGIVCIKYRDIIDFEKKSIYILENKKT